MATFPGRVPASAQAQDMVAAIRGGNYPFWYPKAARQLDLAIDYFVYGTDFTPLALSATVANSIPINSDSAFYILSGVLVETAQDNTTFMANRPLLAMLSEAGGARNLANTPIHVNNWFGTAEEPKYWDIPKLLLPNSTFQVQLQNLEAVARNVRVAFHGFKIFNYTAS
jgi:hypothetical protein